MKEFNAKVLLYSSTILTGLSFGLLTPAQVHADTEAPAQSATITDTESATSQSLATTMSEVPNPASVKDAEPSNTEPTGNTDAN